MIIYFLTATNEYQRTGTSSNDSGLPKKQEDQNGKDYRDFLDNPKTNMCWSFFVHQIAFVRHTYIVYH